jgi:hypothetical protein
LQGKELQVARRRKGRYPNEFRPNLQAEGTAEKNTGKVEKKVGKIEKVFEN